MIECVLGKPGDGMTYQAPVDFSCVVAVCQSTGAHGVGVCPCAAAYPLRGLPSLGEVRYFVSSDRRPRVFKDDSGVWRVMCGEEISGGKQ